MNNNQMLRDYNSEELRFWMVALDEYIRYDPVSGIFFWKKVKTAKTIVGGIVGSRSIGDYCNIKFNGKQIHGHRLAFIAMVNYLPKIVDHIDRVRSNNAWDNLREATYSINVINTGIRSDNTSGVKGVHFDNRRKKWVATIMCDGVSKWLGYFKTKEEAAKVRLNAENFYGFNSYQSYTDR